VQELARAYNVRVDRCRVRHDVQASRSRSRRRERDNVDRRDLGLLARRHEHNDRLLLYAAVPLDRLEHGLGHGDQAASVVGLVEALDVKLELQRTHVRVEVEGTVGVAEEPLRNVFGVGYGRGQRNYADVALDLRADVAHARADDLEDRALFASDQV